MATTLEVIRRVTLEAKERGITELTGKLEKLEKQYQDISAAGATTAKSTESAERAFTRHSRAVDENLRAMERFTTQAKAFGDARAQGRIGEAEHLRLLTLSEQQMRKTMGASDAFAKSTTQVANSQKLARYELINLGRQVQDVGVSLASGQAPLTVLIQQGSQIADVFATSNISLKNFAAQVGPMVAKWGAIGAAITAVGVALYAVNKAFDEALEARQALGGGRGRTLTGVTPEDINRLAAEAPAGMTRTEARAGIIGGIRAGVPNVALIIQARDASLQLAKTLDTELKPAQEEINKLLADRTPRAYEALSQKLGIFDARLVDNIRSLQGQQRWAEAAQLALNGITPALVKNADATTKWERAWKGALSTAQEFLALDVTEIRFPEAPAITPRGDQQVARDYINRRRGTPAADVTEPLGGSMLQANPQALAAAVSAERDASNIANAIEKQNRAYNDQVAALQAVTTAQQAAAAGQAAYSALIGKDISEQERLNAQRNAASLVMVRQAAKQQKLVAAQQAELAMGSQLVAAAQMQGTAGIKRNAMLQEYLRLQTAGIDVTTAASKAQIENAGALAVQAKRIQDAAQAQQTTQQGKNQLDLIRLESRLIDENSIERSRRLEIMKGEQQARDLENQGLASSAELTRKYTREIANANAKLEEQRDIARLDPRGQYTARQTGSTAQEVERMRERSLTTFNQQFANNIARFGYSGDGFGRYVDRFGNAVDEYGRTAEKIAADMSFKVERGTFGGQSGDQQFTSITRQGYMTQLMEQLRQSNEATKIQLGRDDATNEKVAEIVRADNTRVLALAQSQISKAIDALQSQRSQIETQRSAAESKIQKLEEQMRPADRPDPYLERNPDIFFRSGTSAFRENDPLQRLIAEAEAQTRGSDEQIAGIDRQIEELQRQSDEASRTSELISAGVKLQGQELAAIQALVGAVGGLGSAIMQSDYARILAATKATTNQAITEATQQARQQTTTAGGFQGIPVMSGVNSFVLPTRTTNLAGSFQHGGSIPAGMWGIVGEAGAEVVDRPTGVRGPARVTRGGARPIVVNQTIVANAGTRELTQSRGEIAQRSAADLRRVMR